MRLERKQEEELAKRKGLAVRTTLQIIWLIISGIIAYFLINFMLNSEEVNFSYGMIYSTLSIPATIPQEAILAGLVLLVTLVLQVFLWLGFMIASPEGRRKTGDPSLISRNKDPFSDKY